MIHAHGGLPCMAQLQTHLYRYSRNFVNMEMMGREEKKPLKMRALCPDWSSSGRVFACKAWVFSGVLPRAPAPVTRGSVLIPLSQIGGNAHWNPVLAPTLCPRSKGTVKNTSRCSLAPLPQSLQGSPAVCKLVAFL